MNESGDMTQEKERVLDLFQYLIDIPAFQMNMID